MFENHCIYIAGRLSAWNKYRKASQTAKNILLSKLNKRSANNWGQLIRDLSKYGSELVNHIYCLKLEINIITWLWAATGDWCTHRNCISTLKSNRKTTGKGICQIKLHQRLWAWQWPLKRVMLTTLISYFLWK